MKPEKIKLSTYKKSDVFYITEEVDNSKKLRVVRL